MKPTMAQDNKFGHARGGGGCDEMWTELPFPMGFSSHMTMGAIGSPLPTNIISGADLASSTETLAVFTSFNLPSSTNRGASSNSHCSTSSQNIIKWRHNQLSVLIYESHVHVGTLSYITVIINPNGGKRSLLFSFYL